MFTSFSFHTALLFFISVCFSSFSLADIQTPNAHLSFSQRGLSAQGNPAAAAAVIDKKPEHVMLGGMFNMGGGIEYGNLDQLFEAYNNLADDFTPIDPEDDGAVVVLPEEPIEDEDGKIDWDTVFETYPDLEDRLKIVKDKIITSAALLALIAAEGYAKAELNTDAAFILNEDLFGGSLLMGVSGHGYSKAVGILEFPEYNEEQARSELEKLKGLEESDPLQTLDLSAGVTLYYDPASKRAKVTVDNDSLLLIKSAKISKIMLTYSQKSFSNSHGSFYWGVKPIYYNVGLTNVGIRIGDITDAEAVFDDIHNADYFYQSAFDIDLGVGWTAENYQLGLALNNLVESSYNFPEIDRSRFNSVEIMQQLSYHEKYVMERQLKLQGAIFSADSDWSLNFDLDANSIDDPMKDAYQWLNVSAGYASERWWIPSTRFGFSRNLAGSKLAYLTAGATLLKFINLDISTTLDKVELDNTKLMRGVNVNLGVQFEY